MIQSLRNVFSGRLFFSAIYGIHLTFSSTKVKIVPQFFGGYGIIAYLCKQRY
jgi:hypothetical protein